MHLVLKVAITAVLVVLWFARLLALTRRAVVAQSASGPYPNERAKEETFRYVLTRHFYPGAITATLLALAFAAAVWESQVIFLVAMLVGALYFPLAYRWWKYRMWAEQALFENPQYTVIFVVLGLLLVALMILFA